MKAVKMTIRLPEQLHKYLTDKSERTGISIHALMLMDLLKMMDKDTGQGNQEPLATDRGVSEAKEGENPPGDNL